MALTEAVYFIDCNDKGNIFDLLARASSSSNQGQAQNCFKIIVTIK